MPRIYRVKHIKNGEKNYFYPESCKTNKFKEWFSFHFFNIKIWKRICRYCAEQFELCNHSLQPHFNVDDALKTILDYIRL